MFIVPRGCRSASRRLEHGQNCGSFLRGYLACPTGTRKIYLKRGALKSSTGVSWIRLKRHALRIDESCIAHASRVQARRTMLQAHTPGTLRRLEWRPRPVARVQPCLPAQPQVESAGGLRPITRPGENSEGQSRRLQSTSSTSCPYYPSRLVPSEDKHERNDCRGGREDQARCSLECRGSYFSLAPSSVLSSVGGAFKETGSRPILLLRTTPLQPAGLNTNLFRRLAWISLFSFCTSRFWGSPRRSA